MPFPTAKVVETAGTVLMIAAAAGLLHGVSRDGALVAQAVYLASKFKPSWFNFVNFFAEPKYWPGFVALGVTSLFAAHQGGLSANLVLAGIFTTMDGRLFDLLY